ncbi:MAG: sugar ABC transporter permease [Firmicutes bacterium GWF2_51_9]|nr:MAG: sugar ABC transporter permease [Firmicutes bacterium GWF2_51_9]OGS57624.1 MAG: sugar ABC transporter permease [Firmicutes bacterium GWE2_51_13]HAM62213.1 sugar ABC transporter permease [Erysipelotrichaceae bacterium]HBZ42022.1 sugar ABC transporter permease [Erysipelotrichaceae bacterium]
MKTKKMTGWNLLVLLMLILYSIFSLSPILLAILNSGKTQGEILTNILSFPQNFKFDNYLIAFEKINFLRSFLNTMVVVIVGCTGIVLLSAIAGYKLARVKSKLSGFYYSLFVLSMLIPFHSIMITLVKIANVTDLQGKTLGLGIIYIGLGVPMAIFLYTGFIKSIPPELDEAARIDGCGDLRLFFKIIFPQLKPITATIIITNALWMWNDFLLPLLILPNSKTYTILLSTNMLFGQYGNNDWPAILSVLIMAMLPAIVFYLILQKNILKGISEGALKQ